jgi:hypothetical protein
MIVADLIRLLQQQDPRLPVVVEMKLRSGRMTYDTIDLVSPRIDVLLIEGATLPRAIALV